MTPTLHGYELCERVHCSARSSVFSGFRRADGCPVMIKTLGEHLRAERIAALRHEHAILRTLDCEGVIGSYGLEEDDGRLFLILEDFGGASLHDLAKLGREITGTPVPRLVFPMWVARIGAPFVAAASRLAGRRPLYTPAALQPLGGNRNISHARATRELGYQPRPLQETAVDTLQWFENRGVLARQIPLPFAGGQLIDSPGVE